MPYSQVAQIEEAVQRISRRCPEMRVEESIVCRIAVILGRDLTSRLDELLAPAGLAELEYRLLLLLFAHGGSASPGELCAALAQSPANLTRVSDLLVARGLLTRMPSAEDRRRLIMTITADGERQVKALLPQLTRSMTLLFGDFSDGERAQFLEYLKRLLRALDTLPTAGVENRS